MKKTRPAVAIFIDYTLRVPQISKSIEQLKEYMFKDTFEDFEIEGDLDIVDFWKKEIKNPDIGNFYLKLKIPTDDYSFRLTHPKELFYNEEHYLRFLEDYSFNLFVEPDVFCKADIELINIAQKYLFDVHLIDEYNMIRKKGNTCFFLSKSRINFKVLEFLHEKDTLDETKYLGIWNPKKNKDQENGADLNLFKDWFIDLEKKFKENEGNK